ncbi:hypothetical protein HYDPIDRAFT_33827 [Hydnomerulius pinastri MD-312]|uniref:Ribonuclease H1 N-terminal domain-containing protein n=1 Tax=Hydnomerulius pinastri MD-312 TaxID=994086 RepID=A0A0C9W7D6_9AGAM|nr:hypothetical protein HYDPIDRAFT_33827 [Hydnomerulius pinastri MD-312]
MSVATGSSHSGLTSSSASMASLSVKTTTITDTTVERTYVRTKVSAAGSESETRTERTLRRKKEVKEELIGSSTVTPTPQQQDRPSTPVPPPLQSPASRPPVRPLPDNTYLRCPHRYPHPNTFRNPKVKGAHRYYVVIVGQEVGIFWDWNDVALRVHKVSCACYKKCTTFQEAFQRYRVAYERGELQVKPIPGTQFWGDDSEYWDAMEDLSEQLSDIHVA